MVLFQLVKHASLGLLDLAGFLLYNGLRERAGFKAEFLQIEKIKGDEIDESQVLCFFSSSDDFFWLYNAKRCQRLNSPSVDAIRRRHAA